MSKHELESAPRVTTRRTTVFRLDIQISGLFDEATIRWLRNVCRWHTLVCAAVVVSLSIGVYHAGCVTLPLWRPILRLTTAGMSKIKSIYQVLLQRQFPKAR